MKKSFEVLRIPAPEENPNNPTPIKADNSEKLKPVHKTVDAKTNSSRFERTKYSPSEAPW